MNSKYFNVVVFNFGNMSILDINKYFLKKYYLKEIRLLMRSYYC